jgi:hypothetical protein
MATLTATWIDVMPITPTYIEAEFDPEAMTVTVDEPTRERMASASGALHGDEQAAYVRALPVVDGRIDVTEVGGGWAAWNEVVIDAKGSGDE